MANKYDLVEEKNAKMSGSLDNSAEKKSQNEDNSLDNIPTREVSEDDILDFTKRTGLSVFEASAKTGNGVESSFIALTDALAQLPKNKKSA